MSRESRTRLTWLVWPVAVMVLLGLSGCATTGDPLAAGDPRRASCEQLRSLTTELWSVTERGTHVKDVVDVEIANDDMLRLAKRLRAIKGPDSVTRPVASYADSIDAMIKAVRAMATGASEQPAIKAQDKVWEAMQVAFAACGTSPPTD